MRRAFSASSGSTDSNAGGSTSGLSVTLRRSVFSVSMMMPLAGSIQ